MFRLAFTYHKDSRNIKQGINEIIYVIFLGYRRPEVNQERNERREDEYKHLENVSKANFFY